MLLIGADQSNYCLIIVELFRYDIFFNNLQHKNILSKFVGIRGINHLYVTNRGKDRVMLHTREGHTNNCQIIL